LEKNIKILVKIFKKLDCDDRTIITNINNIKVKNSSACIKTIIANMIINRLQSLKEKKNISKNISNYFNINIDIDIDIDIINNDNIINNNINTDNINIDNINTDNNNINNKIYKDSKFDFIPEIDFISGIDVIPEITKVTDTIDIINKAIYNFIDMFYNKYITDRNDCINFIQTFLLKIENDLNINDIIYNQVVTLLYNSFNENSLNNYNKYKEYEYKIKDESLLNLHLDIINELYNKIYNNENDENNENNENNDLFGGIESIFDKEVVSGGTPILIDGYNPKINT